MIPINWLKVQGCWHRFSGQIPTMELSWKTVRCTRCRALFFTLNNALNPMPPLEVPALYRILSRKNPLISPVELELSESCFPSSIWRRRLQMRQITSKEVSSMEVTSNASKHLCERTGHLKCAWSLLSPVRRETVTKYLVKVLSTGLGSSARMSLGFSSGPIPSSFSESGSSGATVPPVKALTTSSWTVSTTCLAVWM